MTDLADDIVYYVYSHHPQVVPFSELELEFGKSREQLRPALEDAREAQLLFQDDAGVWLAEKGLHYARSRWV